MELRFPIALCADRVTESLGDFLLSCESVQTQAYGNEAKMHLVVQRGLIHRFMSKKDDARLVIIDKPKMAIDVGSLARVVRIVLVTRLICECQPWL